MHVCAQPLALFGVIFLLSFCVFATFAAALLGIGTTDAFLAALLCANDIECCRADDQNDHGNRDIIYRIHIINPCVRIQP